MSSYRVAAPGNRAAVSVNTLPAQRIGTVGRGWTLTNLLLLVIAGFYLLEVTARGAGDVFSGENSPSPPTSNGALG